MTLTNHGADAATLELTSYAEVVLRPQAADLAHPAFGNLFVETELVAEPGALLCTRRPRSRRASAPLARPRQRPSRARSAPVSSTRPAGRASSAAGATPAAPAALDPAPALPNTVGAVLDPVLSLRRVVDAAAAAGAPSVSFTTGGRRLARGGARAGRHIPRPARRRAHLRAGLGRRPVELRHLGLSAEQAHRFQRLAALLLFADPALRAPPDVLAPQHARPVGALAVRHLGRPADRAGARRRPGQPPSWSQELLLAHEFWRLNGLAVDLVILNEDPAATSSRSRSSCSRWSARSPAQGHLDQPGGVFVRRADLIAGRGSRPAPGRRAGRAADQPRAGWPASSRAPARRRPADSRRRDRAGPAGAGPPPAPCRSSRSSCCSRTASAASRPTAAST